MRFCCWGRCICVSWIVCILRVIGCGCVELVEVFVFEDVVDVEVGWW